MSDVVKRIIADMGDRRGLRGEWNAIDDDMRAEIVAKWEGFAESALTTARQQLEIDYLTLARRCADLEEHVAKLLPLRLSGKWRSSLMIRIYIAGPLSKGDQALNCRTAIEAGDQLMRAGLHPFVPHLSWCWHMLFPTDYERWMAWAFAFLETCHALLRIPGDSPGADREVSFAHQHDIPVFYNIANVLTWAAAEAERL